jgi:hypothetical protein
MAHARSKLVLDPDRNTRQAVRFLIPLVYALKNRSRASHTEIQVRLIHSI